LEQSTAEYARWISDITEWRHVITESVDSPFSLPCSNGAVAPNGGYSDNARWSRKSAEPSKNEGRPLANAGWLV
jgi:hypothetical protein